MTPNYNSVRKQTLTLNVKTSSYADIRLTSNSDGSGSNILIRLGVNSGNSTFSYVYENGILKFSKLTPNLLSLDKFAYFVISWKFGIIYVSHEIPIIYFYLQAPFDVKFIGVSTGFVINFFIFCYVYF